MNVLSVLRYAGTLREVDCILVFTTSSGKVETQLATPATPPARRVAHQGTVASSPSTSSANEAWSICPYPESRRRNPRVINSYWNVSQSKTPRGTENHGPCRSRRRRLNRATLSARFLGKGQRFLDCARLAKQVDLWWVWAF